MIETVIEIREVLRVMPWTYLYMCFFGSFIVGAITESSAYVVINVMLFLALIVWKMLL